MRHVLLVLCVLSAPACGPATTESSRSLEIASDYGQPFRHSLYWRTGSTMHRAFCRGNTTIYDHASCNVQPAEVPAAAFYHELQTQFGGQTDRMTDWAAEAFVRVDQIDLKLLELLSSDGGTPQRPDLPARIQAKVNEVGTLTVKVTELRDQIARIQQSLARQDNPDLRVQLADLGKQLGEHTSKLAAAETQLAAVRQEYVEANSQLIDAEMYRHLQQQRETAVTASDAYNTYVVQEGQDAIKLRRVLAMLEDNFIYVEDLGSGDSSYMSFIMPFDELFNDLARGAMSFTAQATQASTVVTVQVPRAGALKRLQCDFPTTTEHRCLAVDVTAPFEETESMPNRYVNTRNFNQRVMAHPFINRSPTNGNWRFEVKNTCDGTAVRLTAAPWCEVGVDL